jgi:hypothetical protein
MRAKTIWLWTECLLLFGLLPGLLVYLQLHGGVPLWPVLFVMLACTLALGAADPNVRFRVPGSWALAKPFLRHIFLRALLAALSLAVLTWLFWPQLLWRLPRERPQLWLMILVLYPLVSVAPQEYIFRVFFMQRYRPLFGEGRGMTVANALVFGWAHAFFLNPIAPLLSVLAGALFADTWRRTRSLRAVWIEHALYGQWVFTVGLGWFFYTGSAKHIQQLLE